MNDPVLSDNLLLSLLWVIPLAGSLLTLAIPKSATSFIRWFALGITLATMLVGIMAYSRYVGPGTSADAPLAVRAAANLETISGDTAPGDLIVRHSWIPYFNVQYYLGLDGISLSLILLTGLVRVLSCLASFSIDKQVKGYFSLFLLLVASMNGVFLALDMFLFYVFFEVMLLPMYFLIAIWGGENREYAAIKFLLYTLFGSVFILVAILILYFWSGGEMSHAESMKIWGGTTIAHSFDAVKIAQVASSSRFYNLATQQAVFLLFLTGFLVKLPSFPFHTWLPDAHVQAPTPISMILAGVLLKIGGYGLIRLAWPLAPAGAFYFSYFVAALGVVSIVYGALAAMAQTDFKKLVAYSSVSHMGYVTLGMAVMTLSNDPSYDPRYYAYGINGAMFMQIAHGITSTGMFFLVGVIYERAHTRDLNKLGGLWSIMPIYAAVSFLIFFGSMGLPGLCGFVAEVFVLMASFNYNKALTVFAAASVVLTAGYILWTLQRVFLGKAKDDGHGHGHAYPDLSIREMIIAAPLVIFTVILGVWPSLLLNWMEPSVTQVVKQIVASPVANDLKTQPSAIIASHPAPINQIEVARTAR
jgi:NADH-quinone oxidoreductase subunit M